MEDIYGKMRLYYDKIFSIKTKTVNNLYISHIETFKYFIRIYSFFFAYTYSSQSINKSESPKNPDLRKKVFINYLMNEERYKEDEFRILTAIMNQIDSIIGSPISKEKLMEKPIKMILEEIFDELEGLDWSIEESFPENTDQSGQYQTPELISIFYEKILLDYEEFVSSKPIIKRKKRIGSFYTPWKVIKDIVKYVDLKYQYKIAEIKEKPIITILDPSCGSGSFLLYAAEYYQKKFRSIKGLDKNEIKKHIIERCIYGVDIFELPCIITQIRLYFWLIATSENEEIITDRRLNFNIRKGNSLIGLLKEKMPTDLKYYNKIASFEKRLSEIITGRKIKVPQRYKGKEWFYLSLEIEKAVKTLNIELVELEKLDEVKRDINKIVRENYYEILKSKDIKNAGFSTISLEDYNKIETIFNWPVEFPSIFINGGFDIIVGNPPYGRSVMNYTEKNYAKILYNSCKGETKKYSLNAAAPFLERSIKLLKIRKSNVLGMIVPYSIVRVEEFENLRKYILEETKIYRIEDKAEAFVGVTLEMMTVFLQRKKVSETDYTIEVKKRNSNKIDNVPVKVFLRYKRFMIYYDELWRDIEQDSDIKLKVVLGDYGIDHRICDKDLKKEKDQDYSIPFLHSGKSVNRYKLIPEYFHWTKPLKESKRFVKYYNEERLICTAIGNTLKVTYKPKKVIPGTNVSILEIPKNYSLLGMLIILNSNLMTYLLKKYILAYSNLTVYIHKSYTSLLPIKKPNSEIFSILGKYLLFLHELEEEYKSVIHLIKFYTLLANLSVYELYFTLSKGNLLRILEKTLVKIDFDTHNTNNVTNERMKKNLGILANSIKQLSENEEFTEIMNHIFADSRVKMIEKG